MLYYNFTLNRSAAYFGVSFSDSSVNLSINNSPTKIVQADKPLERLERVSAFRKKKKSLNIDVIFFSIFQHNFFQENLPLLVKFAPLACCIRQLCWKIPEMSQQYHLFG